MLVSLLALAVPPAQAQTATVPRVAVPCSLAEKLDQAGFTLLGQYDDSEAGSDTAAYDYAECLSKGLTRDLAHLPQLSARLAKLRRLYRQLSATDGRLASIMQGGGTLYSHSVPRSFPGIEATLRTLAALAGSSYGGQTGARYTASIQASRQALAARLSLLKGWKPSGGFPFDPAVYKAALTDYENTANAVVRLLGSRNDAATAAGYLRLGGSLFLDDILNNND